VVVGLIPAPPPALPALVVGMLAGFTVGAVEGVGAKQAKFDFLDQLTRTTGRLSPDIAAPGS
jgi:hypothetical protein